MSYKQDSLFVVELAEEDWYGIGSERQAKAAVSFKERALSVGCRTLAIFVLPDPLFSMCGNNKRHRVFECIIEAEKGPYTIKPLFVAEIERDRYYALDEGDQRKLIRTTRDAVNAMAVNGGISGRYEIHIVGQGNYMERVERGKV